MCVPLGFARFVQAADLLCRVYADFTHTYVVHIQFIYIYIYLCVCVSMPMSLYMYMCMCMCMNIYIYIHIYMCMYIISVYTVTCTYTYMHAHTYSDTGICTYTYQHLYVRISLSTYVQAVPLLWQQSLSLPAGREQRCHVAAWEDRLREGLDLCTQHMHACRVLVDQSRTLLLISKEK